VFYHVWDNDGQQTNIIFFRGPGTTSDG
jgi:hypothetical protein